MVQLWWCVQSTLFALSPQIAYPWRRFLLRLFGAKVGAGVRIRPSVRITYPWKIEIGDYSWIGDGSHLYSLGPIRIGRSTCLGPGVFLCTGTHDYHARTFDLQAFPIVIGDQVWLASQAFVAPGVTINDGAVVGARSFVLDDVPALMCASGSPATIVGPR